MYGPKPNSIPIAPKIMPKGTTGNNKGETSKKPFNRFSVFFDIIYFCRFRASTKKDLSNLQSLYPRFITFKYLSVGNLKGVFLVMV